MNRAPPADGRHATRVLDVLERDGRLWLRVTLLGPGRCTGVTEPAAIATGWVPALSGDGRPNAWFYSRGC